MISTAELDRAIVMSANQGIWVVDVDGRTRWANAKMAELLGYSSSEMADLTIYEVLDATGREQAVSVLQRERELRGQVEQVEGMFVRKDGCSVWCLINRGPLLDGDGNHVGSINRVTDITERKQVDEDLLRSQARLAEAQRVAHLGSWEWDLVTDQVTFSDEMRQIMGLGTDSDDFAFVDTIELVHPEDRDLVTRTLAGALLDKPGFDFDTRLVRPAGDVVWIRSVGEIHRDAGGGALFVRGTALNMTAHKKAEEELRRTSARYQMLQTMATLANETVDFERVLQLAVAEIRAHTGWPFGRAYLVSGNPPCLVPIPLSKPGNVPLRQSLDSSVALTDCPPESKLGRQVFLSAKPTWSSFVDDGDAQVLQAGTEMLELMAGFAFPVVVDGLVVAVLEFLSATSVERDEALLAACGQVGTQLARVVERQRAAEGVAAARDAALEMSRLKSEFLATMSHEIRTPMNGVIGLTSLLLDTPLDKLQRQYAEGVHAAGQSLISVINDILDFSKLEAGKIELESAEFDVRSLVADVGLLLAPEASLKQLELLAYCVPEVPAILSGDAGRIRQVLLNLASNAVKFTSSGEVVIKVMGSTLTGDTGSSLRFEIEDTGIGVAAGARERLFESFSQADASTTRRYGGTGLGLAICHRLVEAMGGTIGFDSETGVGSTFWFQIPLALGATPQADGTAPPPDRLAGRRVLVADDNASHRTMLASQLTSWRLRTDSVSNGRSALARMRDMAGKGQPYYLAVIDLGMPDMDGLQLAHIISAEPALASTQMIMLTSPLQVDVPALTLAGVTEWMTKPVSSSDLYQRLTRLTKPPAARHIETGRSPSEDRDVDGTLGRRVLVVDDIDLNQLVAERIVSALGYRVDTVADGAEALKAALGTSYAAILMDCHMPVMDGFEATREIRRRQAGHDRTPIIAMTASVMPEEQERCLAAGMDDYIGKPVTLQAIQKVLAHWTASREDHVARPPSLSAEVNREPPAHFGEPPIDAQRLAGLRQLGALKGEDLLSRFVAMFASSSAAGLAAIRVAAHAENAEDVKQAAHKLVGTSANIGAHRVTALCRRLEQLQNPSETTQLLRELETELVDANNALSLAAAPG